MSEIRARAREKRCKFELIAGEGTPERDFGIALRTHRTALNILIKDSEGPDTGRLSVTLCAKQGWEPAKADCIFWMVQAMESWFHADKDEIESFYGKGFHRGAMKANPSVEEIPKGDLLQGLKDATRNTLKGPYHKTKHGPHLLARIRSDHVRKSAPNVDRLFMFVFGQI